MPQRRLAGASRDATAAAVAAAYFPSAQTVWFSAGADFVSGLVAVRANIAFMICCLRLC